MKSGYDNIYDIIHSDKNYKKESESISILIEEHFSDSKNIELLDVACGSGGHLSNFKFNCSGLDLNSNLVEVACKKKLNVFQDDMRTFDLKKEFDVITCLFGSIAHVNNYQEMVNTLLNFKKHLKNGGFVLIEPWVYLEQYSPRFSSRKISEALAVESINSLEGNVAKLYKKYFYTPLNIDKTIVFEDNFQICCFKKQEYESAFYEAGFFKKHLNINLDEDFINGVYFLC